ncbi:transcription elongation factor GreA [Suttonella ornithocola]|uniref:Transcription elongation factor GreA n=1 Tax=Suttonella ornithocola TaxID=279832 RepID=A0A380MZK8_9GAMM|nr:transcription elongation factor GreA [Suttonella ornithocola]SUO97121.1 Transcript cleavage factor greA [Suttonella ornithocola]
MSKKIPMTKKGADALRTELDILKSEKRPKVIQAISDAREHGDLKENAEYHAAREQQGFIEGRIQELEYKLSNAQIIDVTQLPDNGKVVFGTTVELEDVNSGETMKYKIVGEDEADIKKGLLSNTSPIARALLGKEEGDVVDITVPGGNKSLEIVAVHYID